MTTNPASIRAKLLNISNDNKISFQDLLNRFGAEQFLARLSASPFVDRFIFKGGSLLAYLIHTERQTKDLDFSIRQVSNQVGDLLGVIKSILSVSLDDGLVWDEPTATSLNHPEMEYPGVRTKCLFRLGTARGVLHTDFAAGDLVEAKKTPLERIRYRGKPLLGQDFTILAYPLETIFSEKLQIVIKRAGMNTRMKDYYDLFKLARLESLNPAKVRQSIERTFSNRDTDLKAEIVFEAEVFERLQLYWAAFVKKMNLTDVPATLTDIVATINHRLKEITK